MGDAGVTGEGLRDKAGRKEGRSLAVVATVG